MAVSHEIKSQLAKLLATEDLIVEHRQVETAQFNVQTRVLTLPQWEKASNFVYDMLVGHEVGHALFTPDQDPPIGIPHTYLNIVEDARIEKLMKRKYLGLGKTFYRGYKELSDEDFFVLKDEDVSKMSLPDRINLHFKIGNYIDIAISSGEEQELVDMVADCETFDDVIAASEALYKYCKKEKEQEKVADIQQQPQQDQESSGEETEKQIPQIENQISEDNGDSDSEEREKQDTQNLNIQIGAGDTFDSEVRTVDTLNDKLKELVSKSGTDNTYAELPKVNLDTIIANNSEIHDHIDEYFNLQSARLDIIFDKVDTEFKQFKKSAHKEVNYLVKEFECKKAADSYARATTARTGVLDTTKLHTYKYNEDLFRKVTTLADGKNHGLIFVLDWSGSMSTVLKNTCKQLYNLIWFCKKVSIPFEVYAFTNEWIRQHYDYKVENYVQPNVQPHYEKKEGLLSVSDQFSMMNLLTSKTNGKELDRQMINIWRIANYYSSSWGCSYSIPERLSLSGTPLNEALVSLHQILPKFQKENKLQKVQCVVLTDGEANSLPYHVEIKHTIGDSKPYMGARRMCGGSSFIRDRKLGTTYAVGYNFFKFSEILLNNLKDNFPQVNFIGIRVVSPRDASGFIKMYCDVGSKEHTAIQTEWRKTKSFCIKNSGYDAYFGICSTVLSKDTEFEVDEGATKAKIKSAFVKSLKTKKLNKKVLGEFISLVA
jgi:hypothetical protein